MFGWLRNLVNRFSRENVERKLSKEEEIIDSYRKMYVPDKVDLSKPLNTREYRIFKEEERWAQHADTWYEKACNRAERIMRVDPYPGTKKKLQNAIDFCHLKITPEGVASLTILSVLSVCLITFLGILSKYWLGFIGIPISMAIFIFIASVPLSLYLYYYPSHLKKKYELQAGSEIVMFILYIIIYMRNRASLEDAVAFAARNLSGPLAYDIRKIMWDVELGKYYNIDVALTEYMDKWLENREFIEALQIVRGSLEQIEERRLVMLDEAMNVILDGTREKTRIYSRKLRMPVLLLLALGVLLPIMGLVLFPILAIFLADTFKPLMLFFGYDVVLPLVLWFMIVNILDTRPATFSKIDISENPDVPPNGKFSMKIGSSTYNISALPVAILPSILLIGLGLIMFTAGGEGIAASLLVVIGLFLAPLIYFSLLAYQRIKLRDQIMDMEKEYTEALFQLGNKVAAGHPIEIALDHSIVGMGDLKIKRLYEIALGNIRRLGMTFEQAFFDKDYGAVNFYPSKLIKNVMRTIVDSSRKGVKVVALSMLNISRYLRGIQRTQDEIEEEMSDALDSLRFQAYILSPLVSGIIVTMAVVIMRIMTQLATIMSGMGGIGLGSLGFLGVIWGQMPITPGMFQLIVGIYLVETCILLGMFINGVQNGEDDVGKWNTSAKILTISFVVYIISFISTLMIFGPMIQISLGGLAAG